MIRFDRVLRFGWMRGNLCRDSWLVLRVRLIFRILINTTSVIEKLMLHRHCAVTLYEESTKGSSGGVVYG